MPYPTAPQTFLGTSQARCAYQGRVLFSFFHTLLSNIGCFLCSNFCFASSCTKCSSSSFGNRIKSTNRDTLRFLERKTGCWNPCSTHFHMKTQYYNKYKSH